MSPTRRSVHRALLAGAILPASAGARPESGARTESGAASPEALRAWVRAHPVVHFAAIPDLAPMSFLRRGRYVGMAADLLDLASEHLGLLFRRVDVNGRRDAVERLVRGEIDMLPVAGVTRSRAGAVRFTRPFVHLRFALYARDASVVGRLAGRGVGVPAGYEHLSDELPAGALVVPIDGLRDALDRLRAGEIAATALPSRLLEAWLEREPFPELQRIRGLSARVPFAMAVRHDLPMLERVLDTFLAETAPAALDGLRAAWLGGTDADEPRGGALAAGGAGLVAAGALAVFLRRRAMRREPAAR